MFKILIIGYSSLVKRRVIKSLNENNIPYDVASRSKKQKDLNAEKWYNGYNKALNNSNADIAYVSLPNSLHYIWGLKALKKNFHIIIDKPATITMEELNKLINLAKKKKKIFSEATFFNYHGQIKSILGKIKKKEVKKINTKFLIPKQKKKSILLSYKLKGGVVMDMGPYVATISRLIFKSKPKKMIKNIILSNKITKKLKIFFTYKKSFFNGEFSHDDNYKNLLEIYLKDRVIKLSRVFSPPPNENLETIEIKENKIKTKKFSDDAFINYIKEVFKQIKKKKYSYYEKRMMHDMRIREFLQKD